MPALAFENVMRVYSGRKGCMCGCNGKYKVNSNYVKQADADRGYAHDEEDISDRSVKTIITKMKKMDLQVDDGQEDNYVFAETDSRIYVAYFVKPVNS